MFLAAFGDFSGGFSGIGKDGIFNNLTIVTEGINAIHDMGGKVKMAYGGAMYDMSTKIHNE